MPKYTFECTSCQTEFERNLAMADHETHPCPMCTGPAPRVWMGQGFGFGFATGTGTAQANSGVTKNDYPTADQAVGSSAEGRWAEYRAREAVKNQVRAQSEGRALIRRNVDGAVEYTSGTRDVIDTRKKLVKETKEKGWGTSAPLDPKPPKRTQ